MAGSPSQDAGSGKGEGAERQVPGKHPVGRSPGDAHASFFSNPAANPQAATRMTLDSFRELFRERPAKRFGPVWHAWQLFLALLPGMTIALVCSQFEKRVPPQWKSSTRDAAGEASSTAAPSAQPTKAQATTQSPASPASCADKAPPSNPSAPTTPSVNMLSVSAGAVIPAEFALQMQRRVQELECRLRDIEAARSSGLEQVRITLSSSPATEAKEKDGSQRTYVLPMQGASEAVSAASSSSTSSSHVCQPAASSLWAQGKGLVHSLKSWARGD